MKLELFILPIIWGAIYAQEIQTVQRRTSIYALTTSDHAMYIDPPIKQSGRSKNDLENENWKNDDWIEENGSKTNFRAVEDKRFEDFATIFTNLKRFSIDKSISFSLYNATRLTIFVTGPPDQSRKISVTLNHNIPWHHFTIRPDNNKVFLFENNQILNSTKTDGLEIEEIIVRTDIKTFWKLHDYKVRKAHRVSKQPSEFIIPPTGEEKVYVFLSMDKDCLLEIASSEETVTVEPLQTQEMLKLWIQTSIKVNPNKETRLFISRKRNDTNSHGFWAIAFRTSNPTIKDMSVYNYTAKYDLTGHRIRTLNPSGDENWKFCSEPGKLGPNCDVECEELLGTHFKYCQNHTICNGDECKCSWGFRSPSCEESCPVGTWGLKCRNNCSFECDSCDFITGEKESCGQEANVIKWFMLLGIEMLAALVLLAIICLLVYCNVCKKNKTTEPKIDEESMESMQSTVLLVD